ncbi:MAG: acyltransferase family protein [Chloroflexota bacterium]
MRIQPIPKYIPELDGLRALAILSVLLFHLNFRSNWFSLGWTGVMLFFVLSGFLITGILLEAKKRPHYFRNFYARRALRVLPIYYLTFLAVAAAARTGQEGVGDLGYYVTYTQNYLLGATNFSPSFPIMFNHTWSLAIEEQFYLLWPLAVLWLSRRGLLLLTVALFALGLFSRAAILFSAANPVLIYTSLPTQLDSLAAGAGLAVLVRSGIELRAIARGALGATLAAGAGLVYLIQANGLGSFWHPEEWGARALNLPLFTLMALFWGGVLALAILGRSPLSALLRLGGLRQFGKISYGLYIYHFPVYVVVDRVLSALIPADNTLLADVVPPVAKLLVTYLLALVSWRLIESPLLRLKDRFE